MVAYHTAGGWILAFEQEVNRLLSARSGPIDREGQRYQAFVCGTHRNCVMVRFDTQYDHVPWKEQKPEDAANSLVNRRVPSEQSQ
jgi:hypothetical protein